MNNNALIFISNELMSPQLQKEMRIPLHFITFATIEGKMYKHFRNQGYFNVQDATRTWGNNTIYGAIFLLKDFEFYIRILDAYHLCSLTTLLKNHIKDIHHRVKVHATPIRFDTIDELKRLKYHEGEPTQVQTYLGNITHPKINQRLNKTVSYRNIDGIDKTNFKLLFREVAE